MENRVKTCQRVMFPKSLVNYMKVKLKGSLGVSLVVTEQYWREALQAAAGQGWHWNRSMQGEQIMQVADVNRLSQALKRAGQFPYLADFLKDNSITIL